MTSGALTHHVEGASYAAHWPMCPSGEEGVDLGGLLVGQRES
ncbi:hypothetical protein ACIF8W_02025 [Streptomyces sp. NPDC085639]